MIEYTKHILTSQFEAALAMLKQCIEACPEEHWESRVANGTVRWIAYHTLFFLDLYLSPSEQEFELRELNLRGGDERGSVACLGLTKQEILEYVDICRQKISEAIDTETEQSMQGPSGIPWYSISRGELHLVNIRHVQHHAAQLSAFLRRVVPSIQEDKRALPWVRSGWR